MDEKVKEKPAKKWVWDYIKLGLPLSILGCALKEGKLSLDA